MLEAVLGAVSLIIWSLILVVSLKYAILILRADNRGEGGIVALLALLRAGRARPGTWRGTILLLGLVGAALLYGDGAITPAISVLSAVEGLKVDAPGLAPVILPITLAILVGLFLVQRKGTGFIGGIWDWRCFSASHALPPCRFCFHDRGNCRRAGQARAVPVDQRVQGAEVAAGSGLLPSIGRRSCPS
jgi:K+ potassium transporter